MKSFLILSCLVTLAFGQETPECRCGAFISTVDGEIEVLPFETVEAQNCQDGRQCSDLCRIEWEAMVQGGNLCNETPEGELVGELMCNYLESEYDVTDLEPHEVFLYYELCAGPWQFDGLSTVNQLSCESGDLALDC